jgi:RNA polymerase sigma factor (sigma-70 family)
MAAWGADARYTRLVEEHGTGLLHLAMLLTGNRFDAEDVVQDVLITVASTWRVTQPRSALAYLRKSVSNRAIDVMRRRREVATSDLPDALVEERGFLRYEDDERFFDLVRSLPDGQRATLVLRYYADMDDRAIASVLGCTAATVRSQAHHGLNKLRGSAAITRQERS